MTQHVTIHGRNSVPVNGANGSWVPVQVDPTGAVLVSGNMSVAGWVAVGNGSANVTQRILSSQPVGTDTGLVVISAAHGKLPGGGYNDVAVDSNGSLFTNTTIVNQAVNITTAPFQVGANATSSLSAVAISGNAVIVTSTVDAWVQIGGGSPTAVVNSSSLYVGAGSYSPPITMTNMNNGSTKVAAIAANSSNAIGWVTVSNWG